MIQLSKQLFTKMNKICTQPTGQEFFLVNMYSIKSVCPIEKTLRKYRKKHVFDELTD